MRLFDIISFEEVTEYSFDFIFNSNKLLEKYYHMYVADISSPNNMDMKLVTLINKKTFSNIIDKTDEYEKYYKNIYGEKYPSRVQIFLLNINNKYLLYTHIHAPGIPNDNIKQNYFSALANYINIKKNLKKDTKIKKCRNKIKYTIIVGDFNDDRIPFINNIFTNLYAYIDYRPTSYHQYILDKNIWYDDPIPYKKVDHLLYGDNITINSLETICSNNNFITDSHCGIMYKQVPYYFNDGLWYNNYYFEDNGWPSDHTLNIYTLELY
jgi:hypothetical protein